MTRVRSAWKARTLKSHHEPNVFLHFFGNSRRHRHIGFERRLGVLDRSPFNALLQLANRDEILIELALIVASQFLVQRCGIFSDEIENALVVAFASGSALILIFGGAVTEEAFKDLFRVHFFCVRRGLVAQEKFD